MSDYRRPLDMRLGDSFDQRLLHRRLDWDFEIAQGQLQATEIGVVVVADGKGDVDGVSGKQRGFLEAVGHVPAEGVENGSQFSILSSPIFAAALVGLEF